MHPEKFDFERARGIVWVCDLVGSSSHLNSNETADAIEEFIPRLHWISSVVVEAAGGVFIKWTGDGFLAWFPVPLMRDLPKQSAAVMRAAWQLTVTVNVTQLGVKSPKRFAIRHGITFEQDAMISKIKYPGGLQFLDLLGRDVVLAFRLSGMECAFPNIVTQKLLVESLNSSTDCGLKFAKWKLTGDEVNKFFKGQKLGTGGLYKSSDKIRQGREPKPSTMVRRTKELMKQLYFPRENEFEKRYVDAMQKGPSWCSAVIQEYIDYCAGVAEFVKKYIPVLEQLPDSPKKSAKR